MPVKEPVLTGPKGGRTVEYGGGSSAELKVAGEQSGGEWAVVEWEVHAGDEPPIHTHTREDEMLYVLDGSITAFVGDQRIDVEAGSYAALPKNLPHGLTVKGESARILIILEPAGAEYFFVPRDESDSNPANFGLEIVGPAPE
jgi:quercetin dioxygenase-like cupin family protein